MSRPSGKSGVTDDDAEVLSLDQTLSIELPPLFAFDIPKSAVQIDASVNFLSLSDSLFGIVGGVQSAGASSFEHDNRVLFADKEQIDIVINSTDWPFGNLSDFGTAPMSWWLDDSTIFVLTSGGLAGFLDTATSTWISKTSAPSFELLNGARISGDEFLFWSESRTFVFNSKDDNWKDGPNLPEVDSGSVPFIFSESRQRMLFLLSSGLYASTDDFEAFERVGPGLPSGLVGEALFESHDGRLWLIGQVESGLGIFREDLDNWQYEFVVPVTSDGVRSAADFRSRDRFDYFSFLDDSVVWFQMNLQTGKVAADVVSVEGDLLFGSSVLFTDNVALFLRGAAGPQAIRIQ